MKRRDNIIFGLILGVVIGVTAWSVSAREPGLFGTVPVPKKSAPAAEAAAPQEPSKAKGKVEQLIERGKLSKKPARFYQKVTP